MSPKHDNPFGPTGEFPEGKMSEDDDGALQIGITTDKEGRVIINFGTDVNWIALEHPYAVQFAVTILKRAGAKKVTYEF